MTLAELRRRPIDLRPHEAVALAQTLIHGDIERDSARPPFGLLSLESVALDDTGRVYCLGCAATPSVGEIAMLLHSLLDGRSVPGGLRYTIGRALLDVEAAPFDSLAELSAALQRFEAGDRAQILHVLAARAVSTRDIGVVRARTLPDRRRRGPTSSDLRRELRRVDLSLYEALAARSNGGPDGPTEDKHPSGPFFACVFAGLALIAAGQFVDARGPARLGSNARKGAPRDMALTASAPVAGAGSVDRAVSVPIAAATAAPDRRSGVRWRSAAGPRTVSSPRRQAAPPNGWQARSRRVAVPRPRSAPSSSSARARSSAPPPPTASQTERADEGVLLRIRFEWDNPFKRAH
ncbi:MAG: hypothetical protein AB7Q29_14325 [Vicinamibacterales bacterium]